MNPEWFAGRLRELREQAGLDRQQLADKAGLKLNGIRDLEQGVNKPSWETVVALCQALNVGCDTFLQPPSPELPAAKSGRPKKAEALPEGTAAPVEPQPRGRPPKNKVEPPAAPEPKPASKRRKKGEK